MKTPGFKIILCLICAAFFFLTIGAEEKNDEPVSQEATVKASYILKFTDFVDWPVHSTVLDKSAPFVIGVLGDTQILPGLLEGIKDKKIKNKKIEIKTIKYPELSGIKDCNILFIAEFSRRKFKRIMDAVATLPVLTVGDSEDYARKGVMINMFISESLKVRFNVNRTVAEESNITIYSKLLSITKRIY